MARPSIPYTGRPFYKHDFGIAIADPGLREEVLELSCNGQFAIGGYEIGGPVAGSDAEDERDGGALLAAFGVGDRGVGVLREVFQDFVQARGEVFIGITWCGLRHC